MISAKQSTALLLAALMTLSVSCGKSESETDTQTAEAGTTAPAVTEPADPNEASLMQTLKNLPAKDYSGDAFTILDRDDTVAGSTIDVYTETTNGDPINDAVFRRNQLTEEHFNIKITERRVPDPSGEIRKMVQAGDTACDVFTDGLYTLSTLTTENNLYNLNDMEGLQLSEPWWDQNMNSGFSIAGRVFFVTGDISIMDNEATWCVLFNKKIVNDNDFGDLYQMVRDGTWTLPKMHEMAKAAAKDLNGDGKLTGADDQFGFLTENFNIYAMWCGSGNMIITKNEDDLPEISLYSERGSDVYDKALAFQFDDCTGIFRTTFPTYDDMAVCFKEGRGLFEYGSMSLITYMRESPVDFGILPSPKYDEAQDTYYNTFSCYNTTAIAVPSNVADPARTGTILEAMAEIGRYTLTPAYLDVSLKGKFTRDEESAETIDLILNTRSYDLGAIFQWGNVFSIFSPKDSEKIGTFSSQYEKNRKKLERAVSSYVEKLTANEG